MNISKERGKNIRQQNGCWVKEIICYDEKERLLSETIIYHLKFFYDEFASLLEVSCGLKSIPRNNKHKTMFRLTKFDGTDWIINQNANA